MIATLRVNSADIFPCRFPEDQTSEAGQEKMPIRAALPQMEAQCYSNAG